MSSVKITKVYKIVFNTLHVTSARYFLRKVIVSDEQPRKYILSVAVLIIVKKLRIIITFIL